MKVIINDDEHTATDEHGGTWIINGLIVVKRDDKTEVFYGRDTKICRLVICKGHTSEARAIGNGKINLL